MHGARFMSILVENTTMSLTVPRNIRTELQRLHQHQRNINPSTTTGYKSMPKSLAYSR